MENSPEPARLNFSESLIGICSRVELTNIKDEQNNDYTLCCPVMRFELDGAMMEARHVTFLDKDFEIGDAFDIVIDPDYPFKFKFEGQL